jgi:hypothetical protein
MAAATNPSPSRGGSGALPFVLGGLGLALLLAALLGLFTMRIRIDARESTALPVRAVSGGVWCYDANRDGIVDYIVIARDGTRLIGDGWTPCALIDASSAFREFGWIDTLAAISVRAAPTPAPVESAAGKANP